MNKYEKLDSGSSSRLSSADYSENPAFDHHAEKEKR